MKKTFLFFAVLMISLMICFTACGDDKKDPVETSGVETGEVQTNEPDAPSTNDIGDEETTVAIPDESEPIETETKGTEPAETDPVETDSGEETQHTHAWGDWTIVKEASCTEPGTEERKCDCGETEQQTVAATGHTESEIPAIAPTCTESGMTAGKICAVCNEVLEAQNEVVATGHTEGTAATCTTAAICSVCGQQYGEALAHVYDQETVKTEALKSAATCGSAAVYYKSCACGAISTADEDIFTDGEAVGHVYDQEIVKAEALKSEATCESAAAYYKSCTCGAISTADEDTFTDGEAVAHVFDQETVKAEALKAEATCGSAAVYYKSCACGAISTADTDTFTSGETGAHTYDQQNTAIAGAKVSSASCTRAAIYKKSCVCGALSTSYTDIFTSGSPNGHRGGTATCTTKAICSICDEEYGDLGQHKYTIEKATEATLKTEATCTTKAVYQKSCECGAISESENDTFTYGETLAHTYEREVVKPETVMTPADCSSESEAVYYLSCLYCDDYSQDPEDTFTAGGITHDYVQNAELATARVSDATCQKAAVYKLSCSKCSTLSEDEFEYGGTIDCDFSAENPELDGAEWSPATCDSPAVYFRSCRTCGKIDNQVSNTFKSGDSSTHDYSAQIQKEAAFVSAATCESAAVYHVSCVHCGAIGDLTFIVGDPLAHVYEEDEYVATGATCVEPATKTFRCTNDGCQDSYTNEVGKALGHNIEGVERTEVLVEGTTCTYESYYPCQNPGCTKKVDPKQVFKHTYKASITTPATCKADGVKTLVCSKEGCGDTQTEKIEKSELYHQWDEGALNGSVRIHKCTVTEPEQCNATKSVTVYEGNSTGSIGVDDLENEIELDGANISMDAGVIDAIKDVKKGETVDISAEQLDNEDREDLLTEEQLEQVGDNPIYNFTISDGTDNISTFGENNWVTITLPYTLAPGEDVDSIAIWFISDDGQLESFKATYSAGSEEGEGYVTFKTNHFSYYTVTRLTPAQRCNLYGHNYVTTHVEGSCTTDEYDLAVCVRCHYTEQQNLVKALGHNETTVETPATCTTDGSSVTTCANCDYSVENKIPKTGHEWSEENLAPTCSAEGYKRLTCSQCDTVSEEKKDKLAHEMAATEDVVAPTCEAEGYTVYKCATCDYTENRDYVKATGHSYKAVETDGWSWAEDYSSAAMSFVCEHNEEHVLDKTASVNSTVVTLVCSAGYSETTYKATLVYGGTLYTDTQVVVIGEIQHTYSGKWLTDEATHWQKCSCGENSEKVAHSFSADWTVGEGAHWHECECGYRADVAVHTFENAIVTTQPSCVFDGESTAYCACGATEFTPVPATGVHKYENGSCIECGKSEESDRVPFVDTYVRDGLVAWYDGANNSNGQQDLMADIWKDLSGNQNHIDLRSAVSNSQITWTDGTLMINPATGCYLQLPDGVKEVLMSDAYTIEIVTGNLEYSATSYITLLSSSNDELSVFIRCAEGDNMKLEYKNQDANGDSNRAYLYDAWNYFNGKTLAVTGDLTAFDGTRDMSENPNQAGNVLMYSDGVQIAKGESEYNMDLDYVYLGHTNSLRRWGGEIYAIRVYDRALTADEIASNAAADKLNYRNGTIFQPEKQYDDSEENTPTLEGYTNDHLIFNQETDMIPLTGFYGSSNLMNYLYPYASDRVQWNGAKIMSAEGTPHVVVNVKYEDFCARAGQMPLTGADFGYVVLKMVVDDEFKDMSLNMSAYDKITEQTVNFASGSLISGISFSGDAQLQYLIVDAKGIFTDDQSLRMLSLEFDGMSADTQVYLMEIALFETLDEANAYVQSGSDELPEIPDHSVPELDHLVGYLPLDHSDRDVMGNLTPSKAGRPAYAAGYQGAAFSTGADGYLTLGETWKPGIDSFTVSMWVKGVSTSGQVCLLANQAWGPEDLGFVFVWYQHQDSIRAVFNFNGVKQTYRFNVPDDYLNRWMYVTIVVDRANNQVKMSFDFDDFIVYDMDDAYVGISFDSYNYEGDYPGDDYQSEIVWTTYRPVAIGNDGVGGRSVPNGNLIDEVLVFNGALTYEEMQSIAAYYDVCYHANAEGTIVEPTCGENGLETGTCPDCGSFYERIIPATGDHDFANGSCTVCGTAHDCNYDVSYELMGESCEYGVKLIGTCYCGATETETVYEHLTVNVETIDVSAYENCGGHFGVERCLCGVSGNFFYGGFNHYWMGSSAPTPDGKGDVATYFCNNCAVTWVITSSFTETDEPCTVDYHYTLEVKWSDNLVGTLTLDTLEENHAYTESAQLAEGATSCEDGVIVTGVCSVCGDTFTRTIYWHEWFTKERIDLSAIGACGGFLVQEGCACGAEGYAGRNEFQCGWMTDSETTTDENGKEITIDTNTCVECDLTWTETYYYEDTENPCFKQRFIHVVYTMNGETVCEMNYSERQSFHELEYSFSFADGVTSCEGGVTVMQECVNCGYGWERILTRHQYYEVESIDLRSEFEACGGFLILEACPCGERSNLYWSELICDFVYDKESGIGICTECGLSIEETQTTDKGETSCEVIRHQTITLIKGDKTRTLSSQRTSTSHQFIGTWEGDIESCLNGVTVTLTCYRCGYSGGEGTIEDHVVYMVDCLDFTEVGGCGGIFAVCSCPCGEKTASWYEDLQCQFGWVESDQNNGKGHEACLTCGLTRSETNTTEKIDGTCNVIYRGQITISKDNNTASLSYERTSTSHQFIGTWEGDVESCLNGGTVTLTCYRCGYSGGEGTIKDHVVYMVDCLDFTEVGGCGGIFAVCSCPCGENAGSWYEDLQCQFGWVESDQNDGKGHEACLICGLVRSETNTTEKIDGTCNVIYRGQVTISKDNDTASLSYERNGTEHQYVGTWEGAVDSCLNGVTVTMTCQKCNEYGGERTIKNHETFMVDCLDYTSIGGCGGEYVVYRCPCGESVDYWSRNVQCSFEWVYDKEAQTEYQACTVCGMTLKREQTTQKVENSCKVIYNGTVTISKDGNSASLSYQGNGTEHVYTYSWADGVQSCLDGVDVTSDCIYCDYVYTRTITYHNTYAIDRLDFTTVGGCVGEFRVYSCPCGENAHTAWHDRKCQFSWEYDQETSAEVGTCTECGMTFVQKMSRTEVENSCKVNYIGKVTISKDGNSESMEYAYTQRQHKYTYEWDQNVESCTDGIAFTATCKYADCGYSYSGRVTDHNTHELAVYNLADYQACGGTVTYYGCFCGKEGYMNRNLACDYTYTSNSYYDEENGRTVEVRTYVCETCGMRDTRSWYSEKATDACEEIRYYTETVSVGDTLVGDFTYQDRYVSHNWEYTYTLQEGSNTCEDGVTVSGVCKDCQESSSYTTNGHERFEVSRIELGSVCGGYATEYSCACGQNHSINLYEHVNCDFGSQHINYEELWLEGAINGSQYITEGGHYYRESYGRLYTCSATDPQCAYQIRYAIYWLPVEGETCVIAQYETWQFGYNAETGTFEKEIVIATGRRAQWHSYDEGTEVLETWENGNRKTRGWVYTCSVCQSTYSDLNHYNENGEPVKMEEIAVNTLDNEFNKQYDRVFIQYNGYWVIQLEAFKYADGTMYTRQCSYDGCTRTNVSTDRDGIESSWKEEHCVTTWRWDPQPTCTQFGKEVHVCALCSAELDKAADYKPYGHSWNKISDGVYECYTCGLENANGADGTIVMEDLSTDENYIVGYWNKSNVEFTKYVSIVMADGEVIDLEGITFADETDICAISFSKAAVEAAAATAVAGTAYEGAAYDVRFTFVPYGADSSFDYAITFTTEVTEEVSEAA